MSALPVAELGRTGLRVTRLGLGGAPLGDLFVRLTDAEADGVLEAAWEAGVRLFDTAPFYGFGQSEHRVGRFLRGVPRDDVVLSTKVGRLLRPARPGADRGRWSGGLAFEARFDYGYDGVLRSFEDSLQRLGLPRVDVLLVHDLDRWTHGSDEAVARHLADLERGGWRALDELRRAGDVRALGAGVNETGAIPRFLERFDPDVFLLALPYTLLRQDALRSELPACLERGVSVVVGAPFSSGILAARDPAGAPDRYEPAAPPVVERVRRLRAACDRHGVPLAAAALRFPLAHPAVAAVLPGAVTPDQARENAAHLGRAIPGALWRELREEGLLDPSAPTPGG